MRTASLSAAVAVACLLSACGQKGPLVLPDAQHPRKKLAVPKPASTPANRPAAPAVPADTGNGGGAGDTGNASHTGDAKPDPAPQP